MDVDIAVLFSSSVELNFTTFVCAQLAGPLVATG